MPNLHNRSHANRTFQRMFNHILEVENLKFDIDGNARTTYSLRHYSLQTRPIKVVGKLTFTIWREMQGHQ